MPLCDRSKARRSPFDTITYRVVSQLSTCFDLGPYKTGPAAAR
jgi:hypothetical protein